MLVGASVGSDCVGDFVGFEEVGIREGEVEGDLLVGIKVPVGDTVGLEVIGTNDGARDGDFVGVDKVGCKLGVIVGNEVVGTLEGE
jgi:hypothetical protein